MRLGRSTRFGAHSREMSLTSEKRADSANKFQMRTNQVGDYHTQKKNANSLRLGFVQSETITHTKKNRKCHWLFPRLRLTWRVVMTTRAEKSTALHERPTGLQAGLPKKIVSERRKSEYQILS